MSSSTLLLFGEMEIDISQKIDSVARQASSIAGMCGYAVRLQNEFLDIYGEDCPDNLSIRNRVFFDPKTRAVTKIDKITFNDKNEQVDFTPVWRSPGLEESKEEKDARFKRTALKYVKLVKFGTENSLPAMQGMAIKAVIEEHKIPALKWGYYFDVIGIETKRQFLFWKDHGGHLSFLGLVSKSEVLA